MIAKGWKAANEIQNTTVTRRQYRRSPTLFGCQLSVQHSTKPSIGSNLTDLHTPCSFPVPLADSRCSDMLIAETLCLTFPSSIASKSSGWKGLNLAKTHLLLAQFCLKLCYSSAQMNYLIILSFAANGSLGQWRNHRNPWQAGRDFLSTFCQPFASQLSKGFFFKRKLVRPFGDDSPNPNPIISFQGASKGGFADQE